MIALGLAGGAMLLAGVAPAAASGNTTYYVSPAGSGSGCTQTTPCALSDPLGVAVSGDTIVMEGNDGSYGTSGAPLSAAIDVPSGVTLTGDTSQPIPVIYTTAGVGTDGTGTTVSYLDVEDSASSEWGLIGSATFNRLIVDAPNTDACFFEDTSTVTNTVCNGEWGIGANVTTGSWTVTLNNDTVVGSTNGLQMGLSSGDITYSLENTIVKATGGGGTDIDIGGPVHVTAQHSNYSSVDATRGATVTDPATMNNQMVAPDFVNAASDNFSELAASPTIGAGADDPSGDGPLDLAGALRDIGGRTDIGAYEYVYAPIVSNGTPSGITTTGGTVNATVNPNGATATYRLDYGTSASYGSSTTSQPLPIGANPQAIAVALSGLQPGATYHYRVVATNSSGTTDGADATFSTPPLPVITAFTQTRTRWRDGSAAATFARKRKATPVGTTFTATLNEPGTLTLSFARTISGRTAKGGACVTQTKKNRHRPRCTITEQDGTLSTSAHTAANTITFDGLLASGPRLAPGNYTVSALATAYGVSTSAQTLRFTIAKH